MRLTTFTDYSLRVLIYVGAQPAGRATVADVAAAFGISEHHLVKVVQFLGREGWLENSRGRGGGMKLAVEPDEINVGEVIRRAEDGDVVAECFDPARNRCVITGSCRLSGALREAVEAFYAVLDGYTLADILRNRASIVRVLFPVAVQ